MPAKATAPRRSCTRPELSIVISEPEQEEDADHYPAGFRIQNTFIDVGSTSSQELYHKIRMVKSCPGSLVGRLDALFSKNSEADASTDAPSTPDSTSKGSQAASDRSNSILLFEKVHSEKLSLTRAPPTPLRRSDNAVRSEQQASTVFRSSLSSTAPVFSPGQPLASSALPASWPAVHTFYDDCHPPAPEQRLTLTGTGVVHQLASACGMSTEPAPPQLHAQLPLHSPCAEPHLRHQLASPCGMSTEPAPPPPPPYPPLEWSAASRLREDGTLTLQRLHGNRVHGLRANKPLRRSPEPAIRHVREPVFHHGHEPALQHVPEPMMQPMSEPFMQTMPEPMMQTMPDPVMYHMPEYMMHQHRPDHMMHHMPHHMPEPPMMPPMPEQMMQPMPEPILQTRPPEHMMQTVQDPRMRSMPEPVLRHVPEPLMQPMPEPMVRHVPEPVLRPMAEPVMQHRPEPLLQHLLEPGLQHVREPVRQPLPEAPMPEHLPSFSSWPVELSKPAPPPAELSRTVQQALPPAELSRLLPPAPPSPPAPPPAKSTGSSGRSASATRRWLELRLCQKPVAQVVPEVPPSSASSRAHVVPPRFHVTEPSQPLQLQPEFFAPPASAAVEHELPPPPPPAAGVEESLPSIGSSTHVAGNCKPCAFLHTKGCESSKSCQFCHLCGPGEKKRRQKEKRQAWKTSDPSGPLC
eukprot:TRINITY_DN32038_c0_g1_i1.p1 TRINITY_DN32038_c0_g1~~TRINITY_DN32038_c0_g1_i1.p1  ORF type:complete len:711 (+),score=126.58 TRINITY_DN32038_c0_g1_i1:65-2134(+)